MSIFWRFQCIFLVGVAVCAWATGAALPRTHPPCCYVCTLLRKADNGLFLGLMVLKIGKFLLLKMFPLVRLSDEI